MSFWLDFTSAVFFAVVAHSCVLLAGWATPSDVGLALTYVMYLIGLVQWCTRQFAEIENMTTSVERILAYSKDPPESDVFGHGS